MPCLRCEITVYIRYIIVLVSRVCIYFRTQWCRPLVVNFRLENVSVRFSTPSLPPLSSLLPYLPFPPLEVGPFNLLFPLNFQSHKIHGNITIKNTKILMKMKMYRKYAYTNDLERSFQPSQAL